MGRTELIAGWQQCHSGCSPTPCLQLFWKLRQQTGEGRRDVNNSALPVLSSWSSFSPSPPQTHTTPASGIDPWLVFSASGVLDCDEAQRGPVMWQVAPYLDAFPLLTTRDFDLYSFSLKQQGNVFGLHLIEHLTNEIRFLSCYNNHSELKLVLFILLLFYFSPTLLYSPCLFSGLKNKHSGIPWWSSGQDFTPSLLRMWVQSLVRDLRSHKPYGVVKKKKKKETTVNVLYNSYTRWIH